MDLDAAGVMGGAAAPATKVEENKADVESRWLSTSSAESELDNLWVRGDETVWPIVRTYLLTVSFSTTRYVMTCLGLSIMDGYRRLETS